MGFFKAPSSLKNRKLMDIFVNLRLIIISIVLGFMFVSSCSQQAVFPGQGPVRVVDTESRPVQKQWKGVFNLENGDLSFSNDFDGGRLNGLVQNNDSTVTVLITPENTPVNTSPWYAFKVWSNNSRNLYINMTYQAPARHRYYPKVSLNGIEWSTLDSTYYKEAGKGEGAFGPSSLPLTSTMNVHIGPDTLWIAGQELQTSKHVYEWAETLAKKPYVFISEIGKSKEGRPLKALTIGQMDHNNMVMIISRQHPPEVTGYLAMKAFVETISSESVLANRFREKYTTFVIPLMNPDGVDNGHWRHNAGGIDLNRDWSNFNQPETMAVRKFMDDIINETDGKFYFGIDFHSTWDDIYYTIDPKLKGNMPGLVPDWLEEVKASLPNYQPNIRPDSEMYPTTVSRNFFFTRYGAEALIYEVGDNTPREFVQKKGEVGAVKLMELMLQTD